MTTQIIKEKYTCGKHIYVIQHDLCFTAWKNRPEFEYIVVQKDDKTHNIDEANGYHTQQEAMDIYMNLIISLEDEK